VALLGTAPTASAQTPPRLFLDPGGHTSVVRQVLYTPDGKHLISVGDDKSIRVWDTVTGKQVGAPIYGQVGDDSQGKLLAAALDPSGTTLAVAGVTYMGAAGTDASKNRFVIRIFHLDDVSVASATLQQLLPRKDAIDTQSNADTISGLAFSPNGQQLASCSADTTVRIWNMKNGSCKTLGGHSLYDPNHLAYPDEHSDAVLCLAWSPDGSQIASGSFDKTVRLWDTSSGESLKKIDLKERVRCLAWSPEVLDKAKTILVGTTSDDDHTGSVIAWNLPTNKTRTLSQQDKPVSCLAYSADGQFVAMGQDVGSGGSHVVHVWPAGQVGDSAAGRTFVHENAIQSVTFAPHSETLATGTNNGDIWLWSLASGSASPRRLGGSGRPVTSVAWSKDGKMLRWQSGSDTYLYTMDTANCRLGDMPGPWIDPVLDDGHNHTLTLTDNKHAVALADQSFPNKPSAGDDSQYLKDFVTSETLAHNGQDVIVGSALDLRQFHASNGEMVHRFIGHTAAVLSVSVSPDGNYLASASGDQTVRIWSLRSEDTKLTPILSIFADSHHNFVAWTPRGYYKCSPAGQYMIGWQTNTDEGNKADYSPAADYAASRSQPGVIESLWKYNGDISQALVNASVSDTDIGRIKPPAVDSPSIKSGETVVKNGEAVASDTVQVSAKLIPGRFPLAFVEVKVNGHMQTQGPDTLDDVRDLVASRQPIVRTWTVHLKKGQDNPISVAAYDQPDDSTFQRQSSAATITVNCSLPETHHTPRLTLLTIGVRRYQKFLDLLYTDNDARAIEQAFQAQKGKVFSDVTSIPLINKDATKDNIIAHLKTLGSYGQDDDDYTIVFVAGHGGQIDDKHYYFLPYDVDTSVDADTVKATAVNWDTDFYQYLKNIPGHVLVFLDTCHSAGAKETEADTSATSQTKNTAYWEFMRRLGEEDHDKTTSVITLASCNPGETSQELSRFKHGVFAEALIEGLRVQNNPSRLDKDGQVTLDGLYQYVYQMVAANTAKAQNPPSPLGNITPAIQRLPLAKTTSGGAPQTASR
jgi:WD40 repeat protein